MQKSIILKLIYHYNWKSQKQSKTLLNRSIYNAFVDAKVRFNNKIIDFASKPQDIKKYDIRYLAFWEKVLKIEQCLGVSFVPPKEDVDINSAYLIERLYQNLICRTPAKDNSTIDSVETDMQFIDRDSNISKLKRKSVYFEFEGIDSYDLFEAKFELPRLTCVFNSVVDKYVKRNDKYIIYLIDKNKKEKRYSSTMIFKDIEELNNFKKMEHTDMMNLFYNAKKSNYRYIVINNAPLNETFNR